MGVIIPPGHAQCAIHWQLTGDLEPILNVHGIEVVAGTTDPNAIAQQVYNAWHTAFTVADYDASYNLQKCVVQLGQDAADPLIGEYVGNFQGSRAGTCPSQNVSILVTKVTALGGRRHRGRMFLPAGLVLASEVGETGLLDATRRNTLQAMCTQLRTSLIGGTGIESPELLHATATKWVLNENDQPRRVIDPSAPAPPPPTPITAFSVQNQVATQRRRMRN